MKRLKAKLERVTEKRDILKWPPRTLPRCLGKVHLHSRCSTWAFDPEAYKMMAVHPSGFHPWCAELESQRAPGRGACSTHHAVLVAKRSGVRLQKVSDDLRDLGEQCGINSVHRIISAGPRSQTGYGKLRFKLGGPPSVVAPNHLLRQFDVTKPNKVWSRTSHTLLPMRIGCTWLRSLTCFCVR